MYRKYFKRPLDFVMALIGLVVLSPVFFVIAILVKVKLGSPVIFKQQRPGLNEEIFTIYKFRTMTNELDQYGNLLSDKERLTSFGKWLRSTSLDELPELWNILKGDMSFVGPRPLLLEYLPLYNSEQRKRHQMRPGLTGLAQINGRNAISWEEKFAYDTKYIEKASFIKDHKIIYQTLMRVLKKEGINQRGSASAKYFTGGSKDV